jgi:hypothetical protein
VSRIFRRSVVAAERRRAALTAPSYIIGGAISALVATG